MDSNGDDVSLIKNNYEDLAEAVVKGVAGYIGVPYTAPNTINDNYYIVKSGDTLYGIARKYGVSVNDIKIANNLSSNLLTIGKRLLIPSSNNIKEDNNYYIVKSGDTLYSIAKKYNTTVDEIKRLNNKNNNTLSIGEKLLIPSNNEYYTIKSGDTLYSIASKYNTTVDKLKELNNLSSNLLTIGKTLKVK